MDKTMYKDYMELKSYLLTPEKYGFSVINGRWVLVKDICANTKFTRSYIETIADESTDISITHNATFVCLLCE